MWRHRAQQRSTPVKRETTIAGLASEGLALISGSAGSGRSAVVGSSPTDPVEFRKCARDLKTLSAAQKHTNQERGGSRDPGVKRPGAGRGQLPARSFVISLVSRTRMHYVYYVYIFTYVCVYVYTCTHTYTHSDISSIDHLALREFVSGPPRYHLAIKGVREQFVIIEQNSGP